MTNNMKYLINLAYNGSKFYGYQIQKNQLTVEGELEKCLSKILKYSRPLSGEISAGVCCFIFFKNILYFFDNF